ncbi:MAG: Ig-like domain-containing protein [Paramuribaculum sp.]|nr:Ig-like domain-containing protein [Paramuribaculum sp.]
MKTKLLSFAVLALASVGLCACSEDGPNEPVIPTTIELSQSEIKLTAGQTAQVTATVENAADDSLIEWESADETVATVDQNGEITAVNPGTTTITAKCNDASASCEVTVVPPTTIALSQNELTLKIDETAQLTATAENADNNPVEWTSSDETIATVDATGLVSALAAGQATITAACNGATATCEVTVEAPAAAPNIGDYFYSDGTWSPEINNAKTIIGVVFWTGDPTAQDAKLRADHPECTHGLVIGLDEAQVAWQPAYESISYTVSEWVEANTTGLALPRSGYADNDPLQNIIGYNNTKAIEAFNEADENSNCRVSPIEWTVSYRSKVPAPNSTSDWYLPSPKELSLLCAGEMEGTIYIKKPIMTNAKLINSKFKAIEKTEMDGVTYWSSTESYSATTAILNETAWNYYFAELNRPLSWSMKAWDEYARVRCILAF